MIRPGARLLAGGLAALLAGSAAAAAPAPRAGAPSQAELSTGAFHLKVLMSALQSKDVDTPFKNVLFVCLYENPFGQISDATSKVLAGNKLDPKDPTKVLTVMAGVCGLRPEDGADPKGAPSPKSGPQAPPPGR
jgi:hypothetical protein